VASEPGALVAFFLAVSLTFARIGLDTGPLSQWLHAGLLESRLPRSSSRHGMKAALKAMMVKTDPERCDC
jgi:hypothetical protein